MPKFSPCSFPETVNVSPLSSVDELIEDDRDYQPLSGMIICESDNQLIMIVSANWHHKWIPFYVRNWVIAIDLSDNSLLWKVLVENRRIFNIAGGQYTVLMDNNGENPRVVFHKVFGEIMAIGT